jgi:hypothetical protein
MQLQQSQFPSLAETLSHEHTIENPKQFVLIYHDARSISITNSTICDMRACDAAWAFTNAQHAAGVQLENFL